MALRKVKNFEDRGVQGTCVIRSPGDWMGHLLVDDTVKYSASSNESLREAFIMAVDAYLNKHEKNDDKSKADSLGHAIAAAGRTSSAFKIDPIKPDTPAFLSKQDKYKFDKSGKWVEPVEGTEHDDRFNWHGLPGSLNHLKKESILGTANRIINGERQDSYGAPEDSFQIIAEYWSTFLNAKFKRRTPEFRFVLDPVDVANLMVLFKQARKLGQKPARDTYADSVGYEAIAADRLSTWED